VSSVICFEEAGEVRCEREEERVRRELEEKLKQHVEAKLAELLQRLTQEYEIEVTVDIQTGRGVGRWRRKQQ
jgi:ribosome-associated translation inhibitor RaiA